MLSALDLPAARESAAAAERDAADAKSQLASALQLLRDLEAEVESQARVAEAAKRRVAELESSVLRTKNSLLVDVGSVADSPLNSEDLTYDFETTSDAALQRMRALLDFCATEFSLNTSPGSDWESALEGAKARLMHAQCSGIGDPAYLHIVSIRQRQLLTILRAACISTAQYLDSTLPPLPSIERMSVLRQILVQACAQPADLSVDIAPSAGIAESLHPPAPLSQPSPPVSTTPVISDKTLVESTAHLPPTKPPLSPPRCPTSPPSPPSPLLPTSPAPVSPPENSRQPAPLSQPVSSTVSREPLTQEELRAIACHVADAVMARRLSFQQLFVRADVRQEGMVSAELLAVALASLDVAAVARDGLPQFCAQIPVGGGLICIHEMRAAIPVRSSAASADSRDWAAEQRVLLMSTLRDSGRTLKAFFEDARRHCAGQLTAKDMQARIDQLTGQRGPSAPAHQGVISAFYMEDDIVLGYDDVYDALVCL